MDCNNCEYLNITEQKQNEIFKLTGNKPNHICNKYQTRVYHNTFSFKFPHNKIYPCEQCEKQNGSEAI